jgi:hypothetical protein
MDLGALHQDPVQVVVRDLAAEIGTSTPGLRADSRWKVDHHFLDGVAGHLLGRVHGGAGRARPAPCR